MERVTDFTLATIEMTLTQFQQLPDKVRSLLQLYGTQELQGFGKPVKITIARYRIAELERAMTS